LKGAGRASSAPACYDLVMTTNVDVLYRYQRHPSEASMAALGKVHEVYGIRRIAVDEQEKTVRVEFDFTRLTREVIAQLLRRAGIDIVEEVSLIRPQPAEAPAAVPAK
jgi:hypothetical protein